MLIINGILTRVCDEAADGGPRLGPPGEYR